MTPIRTQVLAIALIAGFTTMMGGPLFAASPHEVCDAMRHGCDKIDALAACCCGDSSESNPSRVPSDRTVAGTDSTHSVAVVSPTFNLPALVVVFVHEGPPPLARPLDLRILFSDLRI